MSQVETETLQRLESFRNERKFDLESKIIISFYDIELNIRLVRLSVVLLEDYQTRSFLMLIVTLFNHSSVLSLK